MNATEMKRALRLHLESDGTANDSTTDELYRQWHNIPPDDETDLEAVEQWACELYSN
jgi:hypothetical protein